MALFGPKKPIQETTLPVDAIIKMRDQGFSNSQIVQTLQREGYKSHQIFDAMNQAETQAAGPVDSGIPPAPQQQTGAPIQQQMQEPEPASAPEYAYDPQPQFQQPTINREEIEEIAESIIEEKWEEFMKSVEKIIEWKETIDAKFGKIEHDIESLKQDYDKLHKGVLGKISEYDRSIVDVGTEVKALGKTFEKILPTLAENVSELSRITSKVKEKK